MHETSNEVCDLEISQIVSVFAVAGFVSELVLTSSFNLDYSAFSATRGS